VTLDDVGVHIQEPTAATPMNRKTDTVSLALASALATTLAGRSVPAAADEGAWRLVPRGPARPSTLRWATDPWIPVPIHSTGLRLP
ncbi:MAG: hypothetical protein ACXWKB_04975, partial [Methyloceanibacter sp.]